MYPKVLDERSMVSDLDLKVAQTLLYLHQKYWDTLTSYDTCPKSLNKIILQPVCI